MKKRFMLLPAIAVIGTLLCAFLWSLLLRFYIDPYTTFFKTTDAPVYAFQISLIFFLILSIICGIRTKKDDYFDISAAFGGAPLLIPAALSILLNSILVLISYVRSVLSLVTAIIGVPASIIMLLIGISLSKKKNPGKAVRCLAILTPLWGLSLIAEKFIPNNETASTCVRAFEMFSALFVFVYIFQIGCLITDSVKDSTRQLFGFICSCGAIFTISFSIGVLVSLISEGYTGFKYSEALILLFFGGSMLLNLLRKNIPDTKNENSEPEACDKDE